MGYIDNILKQPLPIYSNLTQQAYSAKIYQGEPNLIHNVCSTLRLIPITFSRTESSANITHFYLVDENGTKTDIYTDIPTGDLPIYSTSSGTDYIHYVGNQNLVSAVDEGCYYLEITDGTNTWYSEKFRVCNSIITNYYYVEFEYYNIFDKWGFLYDGGQGNVFKNRLRLRTRPYDSREYEEYEEVIDDNELDAKKTFAKSTKIYGCRNITAWDYTSDALQLMKLHTNITFKYGGNESDIKLIKSIEFEKIENTDFARGEIKFTLRNNIFEPSENLSVTAVNNEEFFLLNVDGGYILNTTGGKIIRA